MSRDDPLDRSTRYRPPRSTREVLDELDRRLAANEEIPIDLATDLLVAMTPEDRARWLRLAVELGWRPDYPRS